MSICRACGKDVEAIDGTCPECGAAFDGGTESFDAVITDEPGVAAESPSVSEPLLVVQKGHEVGERFVLDGDSFTVGRDPKSDIFLNDVTVSRRHATIRRVGTEVSIEDAGSLNGTYVNGVRVDEGVLEHGDVVQVGRWQMIFLSGSGT
jgi:hypothetical protein